MQHPRILGEGAQRDFIPGPFVFISNATTAKRLGCPAEDCGCFFRFSPKRSLWGWGKPCRTRFTPLMQDKGRPWCMCEAREPAWLSREHPKPWRTVERALIMADLDGESAQY